MTASSDAPDGGGREFLVVAHTGRAAVVETLDAIARRCAEAGVGLRVVDHDTLADHPEMTYKAEVHPVDPAHLRSIGAEVAVTSADPGSAAGCEVVIVLGGDGTFLRAAELAYPASIPVLGINLGRIGFLAEAEANRVDEVMVQLISGDYRVEDRMTLDVAVLVDGETHGSSWALNEASVQNPSGQGVLGLVTEVDGRPVSAFGADGILVSTPTGSTAYAFSAGGPVMWPDLEAILIVPNNAHALFARPMVTSPRSVVAVEVEPGPYDALVSCDGRRVLPVPAGARLEVVRGHKPLRWVRIDSEPFADRLVTKFDLPVTGWRGKKEV
ncbi:NAD kinase [Williamsia sterculiae]|uniref:NAD kinase n=1 Tax=Williamsia sterculiae TaxID=1344003 RepID=A0A1N7H459_9NOCA|nr:NAD kinase [Williamsia sterculiae]SIS19601.1 NAD+ kinase [Williamsia sterculiae]